jgi:hypothetical protein
MCTYTLYTPRMLKLWHHHMRRIRRVHATSACRTPRPDHGAARGCRAHVSLEAARCSTAPLPSTTTPPPQCPRGASLDHPGTSRTWVHWRRLSARVSTWRTWVHFQPRDVDGASTAITLLTRPSPLPPSPSPLLLLPPPPLLLCPPAASRPDPAGPAESPGPGTASGSRSLHVTP